MLRFLTAGESHGPCLTAIIEGVPAGLLIDVEAINGELSRRQGGFGRGGRMKIEKDKVEFLSGMRFGYTLGSPLTLSIRNKDWVNWEGKMASFGEPQGERVTNPRPGHADLAGIMKYDRQDIRDVLERASARETAVRVAVGSVARQLLSLCKIRISSQVINIGGIGNQGKADDEGDISDAMKGAIQAAKDKGDSLGGIFEIIVDNPLPGLGSHVQWDRRLDGRLAGAMMSIPAVKGVEIGAGFRYADLPGSQTHDEIFYEPGQGYYRKSNNAGGLEGGMTNGEKLVVRAVMKPIPTLMAPLASVDVLTHQATVASTERSDVCAVPACAVVGEAMTAIVLAEALLEKFGGDSIGDLLAAVDSYQGRIRE